MPRKKRTESTNESDNCTAKDEFKKLLEEREQNTNNVMQPITPTVMNENNLSTNLNFQEVVRELCNMRPTEIEDIMKLREAGCPETYMFLIALYLLDTLTGKKRIQADVFKLFMQIVDEDKSKNNEQLLDNFIGVLNDVKKIKSESKSN